MKKLHPETRKYWDSLVRTYRRDVREFGMPATASGLGLRDHWNEKVDYRTNKDGNENGHVPYSSYREFEAYVMQHLKGQKNASRHTKSAKSKAKPLPSFITQKKLRGAKIRHHFDRLLKKIGL